MACSCGSKNHEKTALEVGHFYRLTPAFYGREQITAEDVHNYWWVNAVWTPMFPDTSTGLMTCKVEQVPGDVREIFAVGDTVHMNKGYCPDQIKEVYIAKPKDRWADIE